VNTTYPKATQPTQPADDDYGLPPGGKFLESLTLKELRGRPAPKALVARHIPGMSLGFLHGDSGADVSAFALDWALHLAFGLPSWNGDPLQQKDHGAVIYVAGKGTAGPKTCVAAWMKHHQIPPDRLGRFWLIPTGVNFSCSDAVARFAHALRNDDVGPISLIVLDSLAAAIPGADEDSQNEMSMFIANCDQLRTEFQCSILGVQQASGADLLGEVSTLRYATDYSFKLERQTDPGVRLLHCEKQRNAADGWTERYRLLTVALPGGDSGHVSVRM
jgi:hypothetical protein